VRISRIRLSDWLHRYRSTHRRALSFEEYRDALLSMYREMPHEDASGDAVTRFDDMLSQLERVIGIATDKRKRERTKGDLI
jgi:hypothetical protein